MTPYTEQSTIPPATGHKPHHMHSAASGGAAAIGINPAFEPKHPNFCPQCGESLGQVVGNMPPPTGTLATTGLQEMQGAPATGGTKVRAKAHKPRSKTKPKGGTKHG